MKNTVDSTEKKLEELDLKKVKRIMIIFYSMFGHVERLAEEILAGVNSVEGVKGELWRVPETLSGDILLKMHAKKHSDDIPLLTYDKLHELEKADGFLFGTPTRYGMMAAQMKAFWDSTGGMWVKGSLVGKPAGWFFSTGTLGGGQETTAFTSISQLTHHGMVYVPIGYSFGKELFDVDQVRGGSPYGSGTFAGGDGSRQPTELELKIAKHQGKFTAEFIRKIN